MKSGNYEANVIVNCNALLERADGVVEVPFGAEYGVRLINRGLSRAVAVIYIDGINVSGDGFVVNAGEQWIVERPTDKAVKFCVASSNSHAAAEHGKAGKDIDGTKGLVRVEWRAELTPPPRPRPVTYRGGDFLLSSVSKGLEQPTSRRMDWGTLERRVVLDSQPISNTLETAVTVEGSQSRQSFYEVQTGPLEQNATVIQMKLMGFTPVPKKSSLHKV